MNLHPHTTIRAEQAILLHLYNVGVHQPIEIYQFDLGEHVHPIQFYEIFYRS